MIGPDPNKPYPFFDIFPDWDEKFRKRVIFLKHCITRKNIEVGDFSYYDDPLGAEDFENKNVLYHYPDSKERLLIGKFVAIATNVKFIMSPANHRLSGFSTFPFAIFQKGWEKQDNISELPSRGDTVLANDIWIGYDATIMPGVKIESGAIIGSKAVVVHDVPAYSVVAGNPGKVVKKRFSADVTEQLLEIRWWDWPIEKISKNISCIVHADLEALKKANRSK